MSNNLEGKRVPDVVFKELRGDQVVDVPSREIFAGKTVALFALPGAYTPTCSNRHVPRFNELASELRAAGVDEIVCLSVNDPFVMASWAKDQQADEVHFVPDQNGEFSRQMGMLVDKSAAGLGQRSKRYSLLVRDGVIDKAFVEPDVDGDPYTVSDADTMLRHLNPESKAFEQVTMFAKPGCPFCKKAKDMLDEQGVKYECIDVDERVTMASVLAATGKSTVPQVFVGGKLVGGSDDLKRYLSERERRAQPA